MSLSTVGWGSLVLAAGLSARVIGAFAAVSGGRWGQQALKHVMTNVFKEQCEGEAVHLSGLAAQGHGTGSSGARGSGQGPGGSGRIHQQSGKHR